jgi:GNAT superfamily N-acetyltransferase
MESTLRRVTERDLPAIRTLRREVGWQAYDWALLDAMRPPHAAFFAVEEAGRLVAIGSGIAHGRLGIVGNMVVTADRRRAGLGSRMLEAVLSFLEERGATRVELFATVDGRRLYEKFGFAPLAESSMVVIPPQVVERARTGRVEVRTATPDDLPHLAAYDLPRYGADRSVILRSALEDAERPALLALRDGAPAGYAVLRPAGARIGPWLADDTAVAAAILRGLAAGYPGSRPLTTNLPGENATGRDWLAALGATLTPTDGRMARGAELLRRLDTIYGNSIGALG